MNSKNLEDMALAVLDRAQQYRAVFADIPGQKVLDDLRRCFGGSTQGRSPRQSDVRSAQRDVVLRIDDMLKLAAADQSRAAKELQNDPRRMTAMLTPWSDDGRRNDN